MENLIADSVAILKHNNNIEVAYGWMDVGDVICEKLRLNKPLKEQELVLTNKLSAMIKAITLTDDIVLYRRLTQRFDPIVAGKQFNAMSPNVGTDDIYGPFLVKIIVFRGANALYISDWELINTEVGDQEEKEVLLAPGKFILWEEGEETITTYLYYS